VTSGKFTVVLALFCVVAIWVLGESPLRTQRRTTDEISVTGEIIKPGKYELRKGMTSLQALALAHGATKDAGVDRAVIYRQKDAGGERQEIKLGWRAVMRREKQSVKLLANDTVFVPRK
jgi:protein involved in polysaccharide export with SLBB domain